MSTVSSSVFSRPSNQASIVAINPSKVIVGIVLILTVRNLVHFPLPPTRTESLINRLLWNSAGRLSRVRPT
jgi:hypothetical protein